jgi:xanthine dehydrogenase molybdenum-binding subunit
MKTVGQSVNRVDAFGKVAGEAKYTNDLLPKGCLTAKVMHSTIANGLVKKIDITEAEKIPGVVKIVTCFDVPDIQYPTAGHPWSVEEAHQDIADRKMLNQRIRLYGDDIAAVVAEDSVSCDRAIRAIKVEYEEYPPIPTVEEAMKEGATPLHPDVSKTNLLKHTSFKMPDAGFDYAKTKEKAEKEYGSENIMELAETYETARISHCHLELPTSFAYVDTNGKITVTASTQIPHIMRRVISQALGVPVGKIRVIKPYIGGGFGNKQDVLYEPLNAWLSVQCGGRPVQLEVSREETISGTRTRHAIKGEVKALFTKDGKLLARTLDAFANNGGYASHGHAITANCCTVFKDLYADRYGCRSDGYTVYTSSPTGGAMRAYGIPQAVVFTDFLTDDICAAGGFDPLKFRMENCVPEGFKDPGNGITFYSYGLKKCMEEGAAYIHWDEKRKAYANQTGPVRRGVGMAIFMYKAGVYPISLETAGARMILNQDGSMQVELSATEIGQGADTVFTQMAAETTGITMDRVYIVSTQDTDLSPFDTGAYASRQTFVSGMAVKKCGEEFRQKILDYASFMLDGRKTDELDIRENSIVEKETGKELMPMKKLAETSFYSLERSEPITAEATNHCKKNTFASGCCFADIEVDMPLGLITVKDIVNVHDSGVLINPKLAEAQVHGGMSMSLGYGLSEELLIDEKGRPLNNNLLDYKIPTAMDTPDLHVKFIQLQDPMGPYGNKALGEPPAIPVAPALRNAVLNATGVHMNVLPMTAQRLVAEFKKNNLI